ncbi:uncharacterized protein LOC116297282, partial [Actinia tenebrosa]|uniref:Uncharacterized protein LOC116297282 n=1 Tax=Actinia tenebrosa TaxID=6105 RepID=A0A6P8HYA1_ACTTE
MLSDDQEDMSDEYDEEMKEEIEDEVKKVMECTDDAPIEDEPADGIEIDDDSDSDKENVNDRLRTDGKDCRQQPKAIVFLSHLLMLFQICHLCKSPNPSVSTIQSGTMVTVETKCKSCEKTNVWSSQPLLIGKFPAGNILLSFAILTAGASVKKVLQVLRHINILIYNESTYYYHQKHLLLPSIVTFWRSYQRNIFNQLDGVPVELAGDGRHDSMGHSAKYGTYTIFCCTIGLIINIVLVQVSSMSPKSLFITQRHVIDHFILCVMN